MLAVFALAPRRAVPRRRELGATKIALGTIATTCSPRFSRPFFGGNEDDAPSCPDNGKVVVIRPLAYAQRDPARSPK